MLTVKAPTIVKRELTNQGFIKATASNGIIYRSVSGTAVGEGCFKDAKTGKIFKPYSPELQTKDMLNANRDVKAFSNTYAKGLNDERRVIDFLKSKGFDVRPASREENRMQDIDCWIGSIPVSIKAEHKGLEYNNIYFELENQLTATGEWVKDGWYYKGSATKYVILQGNEIRLYDKQAIVDYVEANGWLRTRTLSWSTKKGQGGTYRTMDTLSGYLCRDSVPYEASWKVAV